MRASLPPSLARAALVLFERGLPVFAGAALAHSGGGELDALKALLLGVLVIAGTIGPSSRGAMLDGVLFGLGPALLAHALTTGSIGALRDPIAWSIAVPFAVYAANPGLVAAARAQSSALFAMLNTLALVALALPVLTGRIHWAIAILPFAAFRVAATTADKLRPGDEFMVSREEADAVAKKILWLSGAWIAGWAGITP
jgi:hypothetical protein